MNKDKILEKAKAILPEDHVILGWGKSFRVKKNFKGFAFDPTLNPCGWEWGTAWVGNLEKVLYVAHKDSEVARLNGLSGDDEEPWQVVSEVGYPEREDYPVFVHHPSGKIGFSRIKPKHGPYPTTEEYFGAIKLDYLSAQEDREITHWKRLRIKTPEPPKQCGTVEINGKRYRKADVEDRLKELSPID